MRTGALLLNLGTPDSPPTRDVRRYLREFLSDPRVIDIPALPRWLLLNLVILPFRPRRSAAAYAKIWTDAGSPLRVHGEALCREVARCRGGDYAVALGMRYGKPSIASALAALRERGVSRFIVLPLFPQYSTAATLSAVEAVRDAARAQSIADPLLFLPPFYDDPGFVSAFAAVIAPRLAEFRPDHVLFSYHGLPERQVRATDRSGAHCFADDGCCDAIVDANRDCYRAQCFATTRALAGALDLAPEAHSTSFQSRLGRTPWIRPYTDLVLPELAAGGVKRVAVVCPAFVADCLETLEEIGIRAQEQWRDCGGEALLLVPSLNATPAWVDAVVRMIRAVGPDDWDQASSSRAAASPEAKVSATPTPAT